MIDKAVIPAAGLGTRLLPATKEQPKEMLPVYSRTPNGEVCLKPTLQLIHEQLYDLGLREFLMTRQGKKGDPGSLHARLLVRDLLAQHGAHASCRRLEAFYRRLTTPLFRGSCNRSRWALVLW